MSNLSWNQLSSTYVRAVTLASQTLVPVITPTPTAPGISILGSLDHRFLNAGAQIVWVAYAAVGAAAPTAAIPADGTTGVGFAIPPDTAYTVSFPYGTQFACIADVLGSTLYVSIGSGPAL